MSLNIRSLFLVVFVTVLLAGCAAPTPTVVATVEVPTSTALSPTEPAPMSTATPGLSGVQVSIPVEGGSATFDATIVGDGEVAAILGYGVNDSVGVLPLVETLGSDDHLQIVAFAYRDVEATSSEDTRAVFAYLRTQNFSRIICITFGFGQTCGALQREPEIIGMVFYDAAFVPAIEADFPKLFLASDPGSPFVTVGQIQREFDQAADPKTFKTYESGSFGLGVFTDPKAGPQLLSDIKDFISGITHGQ